MAKQEQRDPNEVAHYQVLEGKTALLGEHAYGDRATLQLRRGDAGELVKSGVVEEVDPRVLLDVSERPNVPPAGSKR